MEVPPIPSGREISPAMGGGIAPLEARCNAGCKTPVRDGAMERVEGGPESPLRGPRSVRRKPTQIWAPLTPVHLANKVVSPSLTYPGGGGQGVPIIYDAR